MQLNIFALAVSKNSFFLYNMDALYNNIRLHPQIYLPGPLLTFICIYNLRHLWESGGKRETDQLWVCPVSRCCFLITIRKTSNSNKFNNNKK